MKYHQTFGDLLNNRRDFYFLEIILETDVNELFKRNAIYLSGYICHCLFVFFFFLWLWSWKEQNYTTGLKVAAMKPVGNLMNRKLSKEMTSLSVTSLSPHRNSFQAQDTCSVNQIIKCGCLECSTRWISFRLVVVCVFFFFLNTEDALR